MFRELIGEAKQLLVRLEAEYKPDANERSVTERVSEGELEGWYSGVGNLLLQRFGEQSEEYALWRRGLARASADADRDFMHPRGGHWTVHNLLVSIETLEQLRLLQFKASSGQVALTFSSLHPKIVETCEQLFASRSYDESVFAAFRAVEETVRIRSGAAPDAHGVGMISTVMKGDTPKLRFSNLPAEQEAYHVLFRGAIGAFKNLVSHRTVGHDDPTRVLELLALASLLLRAIDDILAIH